MTWSVVDRPCRKSAGSGGSCGSITGSSLERSRRSRSFSGAHSSDIGRSLFASSAGLFGLNTAIMSARLQTRKSETTHALREKLSEPVQH